MKAKITSRERDLIGITVVVVFVIVNYLLITPLWRAWQDAGVKLQRQKHELAKTQATIARAPEWKKEYDQLRQSLGQRTESFQQVSDVLRKIQEVATASGVQVTSTRPMTEENRGVYRVLPVQCAIEATTDSLVHFLFALQTGAGFVSAEQLQVSPRPENVSILRCDIQVRALAAKPRSPTS